MENELINYFQEDENKYLEKRKLCLDLFSTIQNEYNKIENKDVKEIENNLNTVAQRIVSLPKYIKYKIDFERIIPKIISLLYENIKHKVFNKIEISCNDKGDLIFQPSFSFNIKIENSFDKFKYELWSDYASGIIETDYTQKPEFVRLRDFLLSNLDISDMLVRIICDYYNRYFKQLERTKEIIRNSKKIFRNEFKKTQYYKLLTEKQKKSLGKAFKGLNLLKPKSKKIEDLVKNYLKIAYKVNEIPNIRQLHSNIYSGISYSRKLKDIGFIFALLEETKKRFSHKKLSTEKKQLLIKIKLHFEETIKNIQTKESRKTQVVNINKPDYNDNIGNEIENEFNNS
jgi:hypothetical protein